MPPTGEKCTLIEGTITHRNPAAAVGSLADLGTAAEVGIPAAGEGLAGMPPAVDRTGHCLQGITAGNISSVLTNTHNCKTGKGH